MDNGQKTIRELFGGLVTFVIPHYQRAYSWEEKQLEDFFNDLKNQVENKNYFYGTFLFKIAGRLGFFQEIHIVDGQQRLTTLVIFLKEVIRKLQLDGEDTTLLQRLYIWDGDTPKLRTIEEDRTFWYDWILKDNENNPTFDTPSQNRLYHAKSFFRKELEGLDKSTLIRMLNIIEESKILVYSVKDDSEATLIFEMVNDRGKRLTNLESIKSFFMHKIYLGAAEPSVRLEKIQQYFSKIYRVFERMEKKVKEDDVLRFHFIAFEDWTQSEEYSNPRQSIKQKINEMFQNNQQEAIDYIDNFTKSLAQTFINMEKVVTNSYQMEALNDLIALDRMANCYPLILKACRFANDGADRYFEKLLQLLEIFTFRVWGLADKRSNAGVSQLYTLARNFNGNFDSAFQRIREISNWWEVEESIERNIRSTKFYQSFYQEAKYLFWKYENHLRSSGGAKYQKIGFEEFISKDKRTQFTIEHIASQNPSEDKAQKKVMSEVVSDKQLLHHIGNLTIDPKSANSSKGNIPVPEKVSGYFNHAPLMCQNELESYLKDGQWTKESIEERAHRIYQFIKMNWDPNRIV